MEKVKRKRRTDKTHRAGVEPRALPLVHVFIEHLLCVLQGETRKK